ncbi:MAG TPA: glycosyltransferase [Rhizomicrobium sp.]|jgi:glycosyltransferase involved in cell wall biosynthesis|nr:glycosyltransferase [Rhizomicrobium sp.]
MTAPFFSVIIPVYNRAGPLRRALQSVLAQTCQDFEIVVVDDGSRDDPRAVAESFADPRIRFFRQENAGGGAARNAAIDAARGRFIAPLDSDDVFLPHHLERMHALLADTDGSVVGYARIRVYRGPGRVILKPPRAIGEGEHMATYLLADRGFVPTITIVVERQMARRIHYDPVLRIAEDVDFALRLYLAGCRFRMVDEPGAVWMDLADPNRTSAARRDQRFGSWLEQLRPAIPARAYHGGRGWAYAKLVAREHPFAALGLYIGAVLRGCYAPRLAVIVFLQIFLGRRYRRIADHAIRWLKAGLHEPQPSDTPGALEQA